MGIRLRFRIERGRPFTREDGRYNDGVFKGNIQKCSEGFKNRIVLKRKVYLDIALLSFISSLE